MSRISCLQLERRRSQHVWQNTIEAGYLSVQFSSARRLICFPTLLIGAQRLTLIPGLDLAWTWAQPAALVPFALVLRATLAAVPRTGATDVVSPALPCRNWIGP